ncbi:MAG TPA: protein-methionine-sulfoxide reductase catalytic subunit MsrP [Kofleriaceae bacterium]|nr:protein-methionine-sulfoxide reductase catalytic subunit MsrP [Kofleriaceae bacterium]
MSDLSNEITPREVYLNRRTFIRGGLLAATAAGTGLLYRKLNGVDLTVKSGKKIEGIAAAPPGPFKVEGEELTPKASIVHYNNFYEFTTNKDAVAAAAEGFKTDGWKIEVGGLCGKPRVFDLDDFRRIAPPEERVYRHRCVEAWSMVIPWVGFPVARLLAQVEPLSTAKYVAFETLLDPERFPGQREHNGLPWPYVEGLRLDEAMHPLAIFATGLYGEELPPQDGAPVKLVVPWKYGFKGIKSIVKITLVDREPPTTWSKANPDEYGFYANVNPNHDHPRWSQKTESRIGVGRIKTQMFNGYADQVASLYAGMDLDAHF